MKRMKRFAALALMIFLSGCSNPAEKEEIESLRAENEALKAAAETTISTTVPETTTVNTTESTIETTTPATTTMAETTIKQLSKEEVQSIISIAGTKITDINSADGVDVAVFWRNNSDKEIKYITFTFQIYNAVNDIVSDEISGKNTFICKLTGPVPPFQNTIDRILGGDYIDYLFCYYNMSGIVYDDKLGLCDCGPNIDPSTGVRERFAIPLDEYYKITGKTEWETIMYNKTARSVEIMEIDIDYMDGTSITLSPNEIELAYLD